MFCPRESHSVPEVCVYVRGKGEMEIKGGFIEKVAYERGHEWTWIGTDGRDRRTCFAHTI